MSDDLSRDLETIAANIPAAPRGLAELRSIIGSLPPASPLYLPGTMPNELPTTEEQQQGVATGQATGGIMGSGVAVPANTVPGTQVIPGTLPGVTLVDRTVEMTKFVSTIVPPRVVTELPTLPDDQYPNECLVFYTVDELLYRNNGGTWVVATESELTANKIYAGAIAAGAISARELATTILLASLIRTAESGARIEIDQYGIRAYDSTRQVVNIPTDTVNPVGIKALVEASALTVVGDAELRGTANKLTLGSVTSLEVGMSSPATKPTFSQGVQTKAISAAGLGLFYDSAGGVGGATAVYYVLGGTNYLTVYELKASDGTINRQHTIPSTIFDSARSVTALGTEVFVLGQKTGARRVVKFSKSDDWSGTVTHTYYTSVTYPVATPRYPVISADGTYIYILDAEATTGHLMWNYYNSSMTYQGGYDTNVAPGGTTYQPGGLYVGNGDLGAARVCVVGWNDTGTKVYVFNSTGTRQTSEEWSRDGGDVDGLAYDGTYFYTHKGGWMTLNRYAKASVVGGTYWAAYAWWDSVGSDETPVSPRQSLSVTARRFLTLTTPAEPTGVTDRRLYLLQQTSEPTGGTMKRQATTSNETTVLDAYDGATSNVDVTVSGFPSGTAAELKSAGGEWSLKGDGSASFTEGITGIPITATDTSFTITGGGSATYTSKACEYVKLGRLVVFSLRWVINVAGTGTTPLEITSEDTGLPKAQGPFVALGDRSGSGAARILARMGNGTNELTVVSIASMSAPTTLYTGSDMAASNTFSFSGCYISAA